MATEAGVAANLRAAHGRAGFTLAEMLVSIALLAVLSAIIAPSLTRQVDRGGQQRVAADLESIGTASAQFYAQVQRWPAGIRQLGTPITVSDRDLFGRAYPAALVREWRGPYLTRSPTGSTMPSGGGTSINVAFDTVSSDGTLYLRLAVGGVTQQSARLISLQTDGDTIVGTTGLETSAGRVRWKAGTTDSLVYLARVAQR